ncbi:unnamed protein product [Symbiodinium sp. CCMP2456]|nr:unnamed protein product [Symbiodinium sp. CCMP2456]
MDAGMISESSQLAPVTEESEEGLFSLDSEDEEEGLEKVECPKRAMPAKPGVPLFGTIHKTKEFDDEELKNMMKMQHVEALKSREERERFVDLRLINYLGDTCPPIQLTWPLRCEPTLLLCPLPPHCLR